MTVESPYQRRPNEGSDAFDPTSAGYQTDESAREEENVAEHKEYAAEHENEARPEDDDAAAAGARHEWLNTGTDTDRVPESEPAELGAHHEPGFGEEASGDAEPAATDEYEAAGEPAASSEEAVPGEAARAQALPDEAALGETAFAATGSRDELEPEPAEGVAAGSGPLIDAEPAPGLTASAAATPVTETIIPADQASVFVTRLREIQVAFVDDPHKAAEDADRLLGEAVREFAAGVEAQRGALPPGSAEDGSPQTEELRLAVQRYRKLLDVLLSC